jgi:serine/threonine-protein kinase HipA
MIKHKAEVYICDELAGLLWEDESSGFYFKYDKTYLNHAEPKPVSLTLPIQEQEYKSKYLFSFFDGLIPEGWMLDIAIENWKLDPRDRMKCLLFMCEDCIGNVSIKGINS